MAGKTISADLVVIGAGLSGTAAALAAREKGRQVCMIGSSQGASAMSSGALDICGDPCFVPGLPEKTSTDIARNIRELLARNPQHPYHLLADSQDAPGAIISIFKKALAALFSGELEKSLTGSCEKSLPFFTSLGTFKFSAFAPKHTARVDDPVMARPVAVGFFEVLDFDPLYWIKAAEENARKIGKSMDGAGAIKARLEVGTSTSLELASLLEQKDCAENFVNRIQAEKESLKQASVAVIPAVLPFSRRGQILTDLKQKTGCEFRELLSLPPSVPGRRLARQMTKRLEQESVKQIFGKVKGYRREADKIISLEVESSGKIKVEGESFILAAGSFIGGGLKKDPNFRESIFDLPVVCHDKIVHEIFTQKLTSRSIRGPHPLFSVGVKADKNLRPLDHNAEPAFDNLRAAGSILAGSNYLADGTGACLALATGFKAGTI